ncbi:endonuclease/exonuclease/phosphatase family protein [uncultured Roseovarius sp.]|uniref:endonuclease/exonuclease/phosphatase family protein n=1 Tax=Roseovarius sp. TaxID=1486281 RepID=UPI0025F80BCB|nr:endonuclease/exonuclease/phosphatase family protein [uncultured Roseovarius sp.]
MAESLRVASWNVGLDRKGPGLLLRDILRDEDPQIDAIADIVAQVRPDILVLQKVDYDQDLIALRALRDRIAREGWRLEHLFARRPNSGLATGVDMDGDGRFGGARDAQGFGDFSGQGGMAILSRAPIDAAKAEDFSALLWRDLPGAIMPVVAGAPFPSAEAAAVQRLSNVGHWVVPVILPSGPVYLLTFHATPPVFDGPEDLNGRRNHDEIRFWQHYLDGRFTPPPKARFVVIGDANLDPEDSDGRRKAIRGLLDDPRLQDPRPMGPQGAPESATSGDPRFHTAHWPAPGPAGLRVSYVMPSVDIAVRDAGVFAPPAGTPGAAAAGIASHHNMVWVDIAVD